MKTTIQNTYPGFKTDLGDISLAFGSNWIVRIQILPSIFVKKNARHSLCNLLSRHPSNKNKPGKHLKKKIKSLNQIQSLFNKTQNPIAYFSLKRRKTNKQTYSSIKEGDDAAIRNVPWRSFESWRKMAERKGIV